MKYLVDANLMVLLVVGLVRPQLISRHRRLAAYGNDDFERLNDLLGASSGLVISAYVMTEVSNLAVDRIRDPLRSEIRGVIRFLVDNHSERHVSCAASAARPEFRWLGITDAALIEQCGSDCTLVTADEQLARAALAAGKAALHFEAGSVG